MKIFFLFFLLLSIPALSQNFLGISGSNYGGTTPFHYNPANVVGTLQKYTVNLGSLGGTFQNNSARWNAPYSLFGLTTGMVPGKYKENDKGYVQWLEGYGIVDTTSRRLVDTRLNFKMLGPAFHYDDAKLGIGVVVGYNHRYMNTLTDASPIIASLILDGTKLPRYYNNTIDSINGSLYNVRYQEIYVSFGKTIIENQSNRLKAGISLKYLIPSSYNKIHINNLSMTSGGNQSLGTINHGMTTPSSEMITSNANWETLSAIENQGKFNRQYYLSPLYKFNGIGSGYGMDIGVTYEFLTDEFKERSYHGQENIIPVPDYKVKFGLSLLDIGSVKINRGNSYQYDNAEFYILSGSFPRYRGIESVVMGADSLVRTATPTPLNFSRNVSVPNQKVPLPTTIAATVDYRFTHNFFVFGSLRHNLDDTFGSSGIAIAPRYETPDWEVSAVAALEYNYSILNLGLTGRYKWLYIGSDDILGWFNIGKFKSVGMHMGISVPIYGRKEKESPLKCFEPSKIGKKRLFR